LSQSKLTENGAKNRTVLAKEDLKQSYGPLLLFGPPPGAKPVKAIGFGVHNSDL